MAQRKSSIPLSTQSSRGGRSGRSSPQSRKSPTCSQASSQHSDSPSERNTPPTSRLNTPRTRSPTPSVGSGGNHTHTPSLESSPSDAEPRPNGNEKPSKDKGKEREFNRDSDDLASITTRLGQMEAKLDKLLSREKKIHHEETLETATNERIQSSQICHDLEAQNERLEAELHTAREKLDDSRQAQLQTQASLQDLQAAKDRSENEASEWMAQATNKYESLQADYQWAEDNWNRHAKESIMAWDKAKQYEREDAVLKQKISDLEAANEKLARNIRARNLEDIRRKESQRDGESQTEPETEPTSMESRGTDTSSIGWHPNANGETEPPRESELESTGIQDGKQVEQDNRQEDQQQALQDALQHGQREVQQNKQAVEQEHTQQEVTEERVDAEPPSQQVGEQEEPQEEIRDSREEDQQKKTSKGLQADQKESEEDISHDETLTCVGRRLERLISSTQEPVIGGHTKSDNIEQQGMVDTSAGNHQPTFDAPTEQGPPETREVALVGINREPTTAEPSVKPELAHVTSTESPRKKDRHSQGKHKHRHKQRKAGDCHRDRGHHRDRDERHRHQPNHGNNRPSNPEQRIQRRQRETQATRWIWSRSWMKRHFGVRFRRLIPMLNLRLW